MKEDLIIYNNDEDSNHNRIIRYNTNTNSLDQVNTALVSSILLNLQQQQFEMNRQNRHYYSDQNETYNNDNYYYKNDNIIEKIIKLILILLFIIWLAAGLFFNKGWNPFITIPDTFEVFKSKVLSNDSPVGQAKSKIKVCVGDMPCVTDENENTINENEQSKK